MLNRQRNLQPPGCGGEPSELERRVHAEELIVLVRRIGLELSEESPPVRHRHPGGEDVGRLEVEVDVSCDAGIPDAAR